MLPVAIHMDQIASLVVKVVMEIPVEMKHERACILEIGVQISSTAQVQEHQ